MARRSEGRWQFRERVRGIDRTNLAIALAGLFLILVIVVPRIYPPARRGPQCSDLASPIGGNNRSILAQVGNDTQNLELNLSLESEVIRSNEPLRVNLTFVNNDIGPVILYLVPDQQATIGRDQNVGVDLEITQVGVAGVVNDITLPPVAASYINPRFLHLLGSRSRCTEQYEISPSLLGAGGGLPPGDYRIRAFYENNNTGAPPVNPDTPPTATPAYPTSQGVWTGQVISEEVRFTVIAPGAPTPIP